MRPESRPAGTEPLRAPVVQSLLGLLFGLVLGLLELIPHVIQCIARLVSGIANQRSAGDRFDDATITARAKAKIAANEDLKDLNEGDTAEPRYVAYLEREAITADALARSLLLSPEPATEANNDPKPAALVSEPPGSRLRINPSLSQ